MLYYTGHPVCGSKVFFPMMWDSMHLIFKIKYAFPLNVVLISVSVLLCVCHTQGMVGPSGH